MKARGTECRGAVRANGVGAGSGAGGAGASSGVAAAASGAPGAVGADWPEPIVRMGLDAEACAGARAGLAGRRCVRYANASRARVELSAELGVPKLPASLCVWDMPGGRSLAGYAAYGGERLAERAGELSAEAVAGAANKAAAVTLAGTIGAFSLSPTALAFAAECADGGSGADAVATCSVEAGASSSAAAADGASSSDGASGAARGAASSGSSSGAASSGASSASAGSSGSTSTGSNGSAGSSAGSASTGSATSSTTSVSGSAEGFSGSTSSTLDPSAGAASAASSASADAEGEAVAQSDEGDEPITTEEALRAAINSATTGSTITLKASIALTSALDIPSNSNLTISLSGHTLTGASDRAVFDMSSGSLTVSGGTIKATNATALIDNTDAGTSSVSFTQSGTTIKVTKLFTVSESWSYELKGSLTLSQTVEMGVGTRFDFGSTITAYATVTSSVSGGPAFKISGSEVKLSQAAGSSITANSGDALHVESGATGVSLSLYKVTAASSVVRVAAGSSGTVSVNGSSVLVAGGSSGGSSGGVVFDAASGASGWTVDASRGASFSDISVASFLEKGNASQTRVFKYVPGGDAGAIYHIDSLDNLSEWYGTIDGVWCQALAEFDQLWGVREAAGCECVVDATTRAVSFVSDDSTLDTIRGVLDGHSLLSARSGVGGDAVEAALPSDEVMAELAEDGAAEGESRTFAGWQLKDADGNVAEDAQVYSRSEVLAVEVSRDMTFVACYQTVAVPEPEPGEPEPGEPVDPEPEEPTDPKPGEPEPDPDPEEPEPEDPEPTEPDPEKPTEPVDPDPGPEEPTNPEPEPEEPVDPDAGGDKGGESGGTDNGGSEDGDAGTDGGSQDGSQGNDSDGDAEADGGNAGDSDEGNGKGSATLPSTATGDSELPPWTAVGLGAAGFTVPNSADLSRTRSNGRHAASLEGAGADDALPEEASGPADGADDGAGESGDGENGTDGTDGERFSGAWSGISVDGVISNMLPTLKMAAIPLGVAGGAAGVMLLAMGASRRAAQAGAAASKLAGNLTRPRP